MRRAFIVTLGLCLSACGSASAGAHAPTAATVPRVDPLTTAPAKKLPNTTVASAPVKALPWIGTVVEPNTRSPFIHTLDASGVGNVAGCRLVDLSVTATFGGAGGTEYASIRVRNESTEPCFVRGSPYVGFLDVHQRPLAAYVPHRGATDPRVVLVPTSWAELGLTAIGADHCGGPDNDARAGVTTGAIAFGFDADHVRIVRSGEDVPNPNGCPPSLLSFYAGAFVSIPDPSATGSYYAPLQDGLMLNPPVRVRRGETASYAVTFTNRSPNTLPLVGDGCPLYRESLGSTRSPTLLLNCNGTGLIVAANATVRFEMRLAVPAELPLGRTTLRWQFVEPDQPPLTARVIVTN